MTSNERKTSAWLLPCVLAGGVAFSLSAPMALAGTCDLTCPDGAIQDGDGGVCDDADDLVNGGCNLEVPSFDDLGTLSAGSPINYCGVVGIVGDTGRDLDWATFTLDLPGTVTVSIENCVEATGAPAGDITLFLISGSDCNGTTVAAAAGATSPFSINAVLPAGEHIVIVTVNSFAPDGTPCPTNYVATLSVESGEFASCGDPKAGECGEPNGTPGCNDFACCESVCAFNPECCDLGWDESCVELAIEFCDIFLYECVAPNQDNDCVADAIEVNAGDTVAYNTVGANTDGPPQPECNSANNDVQVWGDLWYYWVATGEGVLTATNCFDSSFDSKIAVYDLGTALPSEIDPQELPLFFVSCNEDCADDPLFASEQTVNVVKGNVYLIRLGGFEQATGTGNITFLFEGLPPPQTCDQGGNTELTQSNAPLADAGQVACAGGGITTENQFARSFELTEDFTLNCVDFGWNNSGSSLVGAINVYEDIDGGAPVGPDLVLLGSDEVLLEGTDGPTNLIASFETPIKATAGMFLVVEIDIPASSDGFAVIGGNGAGQTAPTYIKSAPCGIADYTPYSAIGFPNANWALTLIGDTAGSPCPADLDGSGSVDGGDLGILLGAWGPCPAKGGCPADLDGSGSVDGGDLGILLGAWGPCP